MIDKIIHSLVQLLSIAAFGMAVSLLPSSVSNLVLILLILRLLYFLLPSKGKRRSIGLPGGETGGGKPDGVHQCGSTLHSTQHDIRKALVVLDMQQALCADITLRPKGNTLIPKVNLAIDDAHNQGTPVILVRQEFLWIDFLLCCLGMGGRLFTGLKSTELSQDLHVGQSHIFVKHQQDAFRCAAFESYINEHNIEEITLAGLDASACVYKTALAAKNRGYQVTVLEQAVGTQRNMDVIKKNYKKKGISCI